MEPRLLRAFVAVAEELHFRRAAERLHLAQPALSQQVKQLEKEVGALLLRRTTRHVELTDAGRVLLDEARELLHRDSVAIERARRAAEGKVGRLSVGFVESAAFELLPHLLRRFADQAPDVALNLQELSTEPQLSALRDEVNVGIVREIHDAEGLRVQPLLSETLMAALPAGHELAARESLALRELADEPFVLIPRTRVPHVYDHLIDVCRAAGFAPRPGQHALQYTTMLGLVSAGFGVALVPAAVRTLRRIDIALVPVADDHATTQLSLAWRPDQGSSALPGFLATAREVAADVSGIGAGTQRGGGPQPSPSDHVAVSG